MKILLLGASGRVGRQFMAQAKGCGHVIEALVRKPLSGQEWPKEIIFTQGNVVEPDLLSKHIAEGKHDAVVNVLGGGLEKSSIVTDSTRLAIEALPAMTTRYVGISVLTLMSKSLFGKVTAFILSSTFLKHVDLDHHGALTRLQASGLDWTMVACGRISDGPGGATLKRSDRFTGGYRQIQTGDVAREIWRELLTPEHHRRAFGVWE